MAPSHHPTMALPKWRQAIIWTTTGNLLIGPRNNNPSKTGTKYNSVHTIRRPKTSSARLQPFCVGFKVLLNAMALTIFKVHYNDVIWTHRRLKSPASRLFTQPFRWKKTSKLRVTGLCEWNSPVTGEFPAQRASNAENVSIWWRHHV